MSPDGNVLWVVAAGVVIIGAWLLFLRGRKRRNSDSSPADMGEALAGSDPRNAEAMARVEAYVRTALVHLSTMVRPEDRGEHEYQQWVRTSDLSFIRQTHTRADWTPFIVRNQAALRALPEYGRALDALDTDPVIGPQLNNMVGHPAVGGSTIQKEYYLDRFVAAQIRESSTFAFDEPRFRADYLEREARFHRDTLEYLVLAPVAGLGGIESALKLTPDLEIDRFGDEEANYLLTVGLLQRIGVHHDDLAYTTTNFGVRRRFRLPKLVGAEHFKTPVDPASAGVPRVEDEAADVLQALRLHKAGTLWIPGVVTVSRDGVGTSLGWSVVTARPGGPSTDYKLSTSEGEPILQIWRDLTDPKVKSRVFLQTALRRFGFAGERLRTEDRLVDLMIAAEALFLTEWTKHQQRTELSYRLALRCAFFIDIDGTIRRQRFEHMRVAYDARSNLVHGGALPKALTTEKELAVFSTTTEEYLRSGLRRMLTLAKSGTADAALVDWDELVLGAGASGDAPE